MRTIIIFSVTFDEHATFVCDKLQNESRRVIRVDADRLCEKVPKIAVIPDQGVVLNGNLIDPSSTSILYRRITHVHEESGDQQKDDKLAIEQWNGLNKAIAFFLEDCFWVSPPPAVQRASSKPLQLKYANAIGLAIPETVITNDLQYIQQLRPQEICVKTLEQTYWASGTAVEGIYTNRITRDDLTEDNVRAIPAIWQEYVEKSYEVRVTIVGDDVFACRIENQHSEKARVDWRKYDFPRVPHRSHTLPSEVTDLLLQLMQVLSLKYAAIDMAVDRKGNYVFLEINPTGQWLWIEDFTGMPITDCLCNMLIRGKGK